MKQKLSFYNWSIKKLHLTEPHILNRAKISVIYTVMLFSIIKACIAISVAWYYEQYFQLGRAAVITIIYIFLVKILLANKSYLKAISHIVLGIGLFIIWSNVFISAQNINILTLQFLFMLILCSFYLLGNRLGIFYSLLGTIPILISMVFGTKLFSGSVSPDVLESPGFEIIAILNFVTIIIAHYLFQQAFINNIAEKETLNAKLQVAVEDANLAAKSKSDFLSTMSHELRTPLNSVIGMTDLLLDDINENDRLENLRILKFSAVSLHSLINDILDFNKLGSEKIGLEDLSVDLNLLICDICSGLRFQAQEKGINLILKIDEQIKDKLLITDPTRLTQIIYNLVGNAIKFTAQGSVSIYLDVVNVDCDSIDIKFSVIDTGIGISSQEQEIIFEPFIQASSSTTRKFGGTGLGLSIVKQLLLLFNSSIEVESEAGEGSKFFFQISFKLNRQPFDEKLTKVSPYYDLSTLRILIVEDNSMNRLLLKKVLYNWKNEPDFAVNGKEAIDCASSKVYDVILMDIHMPIIDGYEAARAIRNIAGYDISKTCIIAFTASVSDNLYDKIKDAGMDDYICKPFNNQELYKKLKEVASRIKS